jgi:hypothetical protein
MWLLLLSLYVLLDLFLEETQVQFAQGIGAQATAVIGRIFSDEGDGFELVGDAIEADGVDALGAQGLKEQKRFEIGVGGEHPHCDEDYDDDDHGRRLRSRLSRRKRSADLHRLLRAAYSPSTVRIGGERRRAPSPFTVHRHRHGEWGAMVEVR